jgi:Secretion system C-terminal sorting domain
MEDEGTTIGIYPNPTSDLIYFTKPTDFQLYGIDGKLIRRVSNVSSHDLSDLKSGVYMIRSGIQSKLVVKN